MTAAVTQRLRRLADDLDRYDEITDAEWRAEMQRAVVVEARVLLADFGATIGMSADDVIAVVGRPPSRSG